MSQFLSHVDHVNVVVSDMERSLRFYVGALGMEQTFSGELTGEWIEQVSGLAGVSALCAFCQPSGGGTRVELLQYRAPNGAKLPDNALANTLGVRHFALEVDDIAAWHERLAKAGVQFVSPPVRVPFPVRGACKRLCYLRDPDGTLIELASYSDVTD